MMWKKPRIRESSSEGFGEGKIDPKENLLGRKLVLQTQEETLIISKIILKALICINKSNSCDDLLWP